VPQLQYSSYMEDKRIGPIPGGKETAQGSFLKYMGDEFRKLLLSEGSAQVIMAGTLTIMTLNLTVMKQTVSIWKPTASIWRPAVSICRQHR
jgi:hypothetical protein